MNEYFPLQLHQKHHGGCRKSTMTHEHEAEAVTVLDSSLGVRMMQENQPWHEGVRMTIQDGAGIQNIGDLSVFEQGLSVTQVAHSMICWKTHV